MLALDLLAVLVGTTLVGNEIAVAAFAHPALWRVDELSHRRVAREIAAALGKAAPVWYVASVSLVAASAWAHRDGRIGAVAGAWLLAIAATVAFLAPLNARVARWDPELPPEDWRAMRRRWDGWHTARTAWLLAAQALLVALLVR